MVVINVYQTPMHGLWAYAPAVALADPAMRRMLVDWCEDGYPTADDALAAAMRDRTIPRCAVIVVE